MPAPTINKRLLTDTLRKMANEVAPGKWEGRSETFHERLARVLWLAATGYVHEATVDGEQVQKLVMPNLGAQAVILDRLEGKVPSVNAEDDATPAARDKVSALGVARINSLSNVAVQQPLDSPPN